MHFSTLSVMAFYVISAVMASPVSFNIVVDDVATRGNGVEIVFLVTCNGDPHTSTAAYYANAADADTYGANWPDAVSDVRGTAVIPFTNSPGRGTVWEDMTYYFADSHLDVHLTIYDPGWYNYAANATNSYGTTFNCMMDDGRQVYSDCFSNYYCM